MGTNANHWAKPGLALVTGLGNIAHRDTSNWLLSRRRRNDSLALAGLRDLEGAGTDIACDDFRP